MKEKRDKNGNTDRHTKIKKGAKKEKEEEEKKERRRRIRQGRKGGREEKGKGKIRKRGKEKDTKK